MLNAQIGMLLFQKAGVLMQTGQKTGLKAAYKAAIPYLEASQVTGAKAKLLQQLWPTWAMLAVAHYRTDGGIDSAVEVLENAVRSLRNPVSSGHCMPGFSTRVSGWTTPSASRAAKKKRKTTNIFAKISHWYKTANR